MCRLRFAHAITAHMLAIGGEIRNLELIQLARSNSRASPKLYPRAPVDPCNRARKTGISRQAANKISLPKLDSGFAARNHASHINFHVAKAAILLCPSLCNLRREV